MKLSKKQKEVIRLMRRGNILSKFVIGVHLQNLSSVSVATFFALYNKGLIKSYGKRNFGQEYVLTPLGKTIKID